MNIYKAFERHNEEFLKFEDIPNKRSKYRDVHAFLLIEKILPDDDEPKIVSSSGSSEIWLSVDVHELSKLVSEEDVLELVRCGIRYDSNKHSLSMFT